MYEALCAEESIELADAALYRAKALGRNQGVGIIATEAAAQNPTEINLHSVRQAKPPVARTVMTRCSTEVPVLLPLLAAEHAASAGDH